MGLFLAAVLAACGGGPEAVGGGAATPSPIPSDPGPSVPGPSDPGPAASAPGSPPPVVQPGAPGQAGRVLSPEAITELTRPPHTDADVRFMQDMIGHHAQALEMTALVPERSQRDDIRLLARRIEISQGSEIALMSRWLEERGEEVPDPSAHGHHHSGDHAGRGADEPRHHAEHEGHGGMPGMLSQAQLHRLASATGVEFDRLFLEFMIFHHEGALTMVAELFASPGAGQGGEIFEFASHVDGDQRIEIARMYRMLTTVP